MQAFANRTRALFFVAIVLTLFVVSSSPMWAGAADRFSTASQKQTTEVQLTSEMAKPVGVELNADINADINADVDAEPVKAPPARIDLASDYSSAIVTDHVASNEMMHYLVRGIPGQRLRVVLDAVPPVAEFALHGVDDRQVYHALQADAGKETNGEWSTQEWTGILPNDQDYLLSVAGVGEDADFMVTLELHKEDGLFQLDPAEVLIPEGKQAGAVSGRVDASTQDRYRIQVDAGKSVNLSLKADDPSVTFGIYGLSDGRPYKWLYDNANAWSFVAPQSQEYLLIVATENEAADYSLVITRP